MPGFETAAKTIKAAIAQHEAEHKFRKTPVDIATPFFGTRASGEPFCRLAKEHIGGHDCVVLTSGPCTYERLGQLLFVLGYLAGRRAGRIAVVMDYFFLGRSDKDEDANNELALPGFVTHLLQAAAYGKLDRVITADMHAPQSVVGGPLGLITEIHLGRLLLEQAVAEARQLTDRVCLAYPDDGAAKRDAGAIEEIINRLGLSDLPKVFGAKRRVSSEKSDLHKIFGNIEGVRGSIVLSVDDEIATFGTTGKYARALKGTSYGAAQVWAVASHGVFCGPAINLMSAADCPVDRIFVTDTIPLDNRPELAPLTASGKIVVVSWLKALGVIVRLHHWDRDIRRVT
ncbi:MAG: hypothetical protein WC702_00245 [Patescibacteria group bacterium]|jgi:phosphoribosylpyrophosphate synthetase